MRARAARPFAAPPPGGAYVLALAACIATVAIGCADERPGATEVHPTPKTTVVIKDDEYHPSTVRVPVGTRVTWVNRDLAPNTVETAGVDFFEFDREKLDEQNRFDLHTVSMGEAESVLFDAPGRYRYRSSLAIDMEGAVIVTAGAR